MKSSLLETATNTNEKGFEERDDEEGCGETQSLPQLFCCSSDFAQEEGQDAHVPLRSTLDQVMVGFQIAIQKAQEDAELAPSGVASP